MKVTREIFLILKKSRRGKMRKAFKLSIKRTDQESNKLFFYTVFFVLNKNVLQEINKGEFKF